jgi:hypothetical protein
MTVSKTGTIKKTPIAQIGMTAHKVTIADEIEVETKYHLDPPLTPAQLAACWLDPSEREEPTRQRWKLICGGRRHEISVGGMEVLKFWLAQTEALNEGHVKFECDTHFGWALIKPRVLRKYNLRNLAFNSMADRVHSLSIRSREPLYDTDAHPNHVRNVLRAVKVRYPNVHFEHEGCETSGQCPIGLQDALLKLAMETHGRKGVSS